MAGRLSFFLRGRRGKQKPSVEISPSLSPHLLRILHLGSSAALCRLDLPQVMLLKDSAEYFNGPNLLPGGGVLGQKSGRGGKGNWQI